MLSVFDDVGAGEQRLAAQPAADGPGFVDGLRRARPVTMLYVVLGVVEEAMGEMVGGTVLAQADHGRGEGAVGALMASAGREAGASQVPLGPQERDDVSWLVRVEQIEQPASRGGVVELMCGPGGQRPRPDQFAMTYAQGGGVGEGGASAPQRLD